MTKHSQVPAKLPSELDHSDDELAELGTRYAAGRLADGAITFLHHAEDDDAELAPCGFDATWRAALAARVAALQVQYTVRVGAASEARPSGAAVDQAEVELQAWVRRYRAVMAASPRPVREAAPPVHSRKPELRAGEVLAAADFVRKHAADTARYGGGTPFADDGQACVQAFTASRAAHAVERGKVGPEVRALYVLEGVVAAELARLSQMARGILPPARAQLYSLEHLRASRGRAHKSMPVPAPQSSTPASLSVAK